MADTTSETSSYLQYIAGLALGGLGMVSGWLWRVMNTRIERMENATVELRKNTDGHVSDLYDKHAEASKHIERLDADSQTAKRDRGEMLGMLHEMRQDFKAFNGKLDAAIQSRRLGDK